MTEIPMLVNPFLLTAIFSYLLGSIPFGYILVRAFKGEDVRQSGSGNIGATNVSRTSASLGVVTLVLDALKGIAAVMLARSLFPGRAGLLAWAALFAIVGHMFPVWLKFRGGKGVATGVGAFALLVPKTVLVAVAIFVGVVLLFRYVSLGSIVAFMLFPLLAWGMNRTEITYGTLDLMIVASVLVVLKHHNNIRRLLAGTEGRFQLRRG